jgi:hypothetical protein
MKRYAIVDSNNVVNNIIIWDEASQWSPPEGMKMVKAEHVLCDIGWTHDGESFIAPPEAPVEPAPETAAE